MSGTALAGSSGLLSSWSFQGGTHLLPFKRGIYFPATPGCHLHVHPSAPGSWFHLQRRQRVITFKPLSTSGPPASLLMGPVITLDWSGKPTIPSLSQSLFLHHICMPFATWGDMCTGPEGWGCARFWGPRFCPPHHSRLCSSLKSDLLGCVSVQCYLGLRGWWCYVCDKCLLCQLNSACIFVQLERNRHCPKILFLVYSWTHFSPCHHTGRVEPMDERPPNISVTAHHVGLHTIITSWCSHILLWEVEHLREMLATRWHEDCLVMAGSQPPLSCYRFLLFPRIRSLAWPLRCSALANLGNFHSGSLGTTSKGNDLMDETTAKFK